MNDTRPVLKSAARRRMAILKDLVAAPQTLSLLDQIVVSGSNFFTLIYLGRHLDAEQYGFFSLAMIAVLFLANLQRALITRPMELLRGAESAEHFLGRLIVLFRVLCLMTLIAIALLGVFSIRFFPYPDLFASCAVYAACFFLQEMMRRYWYAINNIRGAFRSDLVSYGGQVAGLFAVEMIWGVNGSSAFAVMAATSLAAFAWDVRVSNLCAGAPHLSMRDIVRQNWRISKWLTLSVFVIWGAGQVYPLLVAELGPVAVGTFAAGNNIMRGVSLLVQTVDNYLPSRAAVLLHEKGVREFRRHLVRTVSCNAGAGLLFALIVYVFADRIMHVVYDGAYDGDTHVLRLMVPGAFCNLMGAILGAYSLAMADARASFLANLAATVCTFTLGYWCIRTYGITGAAIAFSLTAATSMIVQGCLVTARLKAFERST